MITHFVIRRAGKPNQHHRYYGSEQGARRVAQMMADRDNANVILELYGRNGVVVARPNKTKGEGK